MRRKTAGYPVGSRCTNAMKKGQREMARSRHMAQPAKPHTRDAINRISMPALTLLLVALFWLMLIAVYCIPTDFMKDNLIESEQILKTENLYPASYTTGKSYDNFTVAIMLDEAALGNENPIKDSVEARYYYDDDVISTVAHSVNGEWNTSYSRYWHGYLVFLKPLLLLFDVRGIRLLLQTTMLVLLGLASIAFYRRWGNRGILFAVALLLSMGLFGVADASATLPIFSSFAIATLGCIVLVRHVEWTDYELRRAFFVIGAVTVYFDFLDNPIITLGLSLLTVVLLRYRSSSAQDLVKTILQGILFWGLGYGILWGAKWILAAIVLGPSAFVDAISQLLFRTGMKNVDGIPETSAASAITKNLNAIGVLAPTILVLAIVLVVGITVMAIKSKREQRTHVIAFGCGIILIAALPFAWYCGASNHSDIHAVLLTYRNLIVTLDALLIGLFEIGALMHDRKVQLQKSQDC